MPVAPLFYPAVNVQPPATKVVFCLLLQAPLLFSVSVLVCGREMLVRAYDFCAWTHGQAKLLR